MTDEMRTSDRPLPAPDPVSEEFWAGCARGELLIQRCPACGHRQFYPRACCTECGTTPEWERASGRGMVHTFTVIRQNYAKPFRELLPYVVAIVELDEGPRMMGAISGCGIDEVAIGMAVEVWFEAPKDKEGKTLEDMALPYWRPFTSG